MYSSRCRRWYLFNIFSILCRGRPIQHLERCCPHILFANIVHSKGEVITPLVFIFGAVGHGGRFLKLFVVPPSAYCFILYYIIIIIPPSVETPLFSGYYFISRCWRCICTRAGVGVGIFYYISFFMFYNSTAIGRDSAFLLVLFRSRCRRFFCTLAGVGVGIF